MSGMSLYSAKATPSSSRWVASFDGKRFRIHWRELLRHPLAFAKVWRAWRNTRAR